MLRPVSKSANGGPTVSWPWRVRPAPNPSADKPRDGGLRRLCGNIDAKSVLTPRLVFSFIAVWLALSAADAAGGSKLYPLKFRIPPQEMEALAEALHFTVPPGTRRAVVTLETADPAHDLDLALRFGCAFSAESGLAFADHLAATPGQGSEEIVLDAGSDPPLQTGVYFIGLAVRTLNTAISGALNVVLEGGAPPETFLISTFSKGHEEGWRRNFLPSDLVGATTGDFEGELFVHPGGFLRIEDFAGPSRDFLVAPPRFRGNFADFTHGRFEFDLRHAAGQGPLFPIELIALGADSAYRWRGPAPPLHSWTHVTAPLSADQWQRVAGNATLTEVLRRLEGLELSMDFGPGPEVNDLDNFAFHGEPPLRSPLPSSGEMSSMFEAGPGGWTVNHPASGILGASIGAEKATAERSSPGRGSDGFLLLSDPSGIGSDFALAPPKYLGNLAVLDRPWLEFYFRKIEGAFPEKGVTVRLVGSGTVYRWTGARPRDTWERFRVPLLANHWILEQGKSSFDEVLRNVERLEIAMDLTWGPEEHGLDDFYLRTGYVEPSGPAILLERELVELTVEQGSEPQALAIGIDSAGGPLGWTAEVNAEAASWLSLGEISGETPGELRLRVSPAGLPVGTHRGLVTVRTGRDGILRPKTVTLELTVASAAQPWRALSRRRGR